MKKEQVTSAQAICSILMFLFGSSVIMGINTDVNQDTWIVILTAAALSVPLYLMYARIIRIFPEHDLFNILETLFGKILGKLLTLAMSAYAIYLSALVLRDFAEFTEISTLPETPKLPIMILMAAATVYLARSRMHALGKWSLISAFLVLFVVVLTSVAAIPELKPDLLKPVLEHGPSELAPVVLQVFSFPFAETVIFLCLAGSFQKQDSPYKSYFFALLLAVLVFLSVFVRNYNLLGPKLSSDSYFPSYVAVRIIAVSDFLIRMEGSISSNFLLAGIIKISACLLAASKGMARLFNLRDYRFIILPVGVLSLILCATIYRNTMELFNALQQYPYHAFPFQVIIPLITWIAAEIHAGKRRNRAAEPTAE